MRDCPYAMAELLPHGPPMVLIDRVIDWDQGRLDAEVEIRGDCILYESGQGVPCHAGIEFMAQACGAYAGLEAKQAGQPVRIGFLLGTRHYTSKVPWFRLGEVLTISVSEVLREDPMAVFLCRILHDGQDVASARLNLYQPEDVSAMLVGSRQDWTS